MTASRDVTTSGLGVGDRVHIRQPDGTTVSGRLVDDFAEHLEPARDLGRSWAMPHRWAVALDTGVLRFVDDTDLTNSGHETTDPPSTTDPTAPPSPADHDVATSTPPTDADRP